MHTGNKHKEVVKHSAFGYMADPPDLYAGKRNHKRRCNYLRLSRKLEHKKLRRDAANILRKEAMNMCVEMSKRDKCVESAIKMAEATEGDGVVAFIFDKTKKDVLVVSATNPRLKQEDDRYMREVARECLRVLQLKKFGNVTEYHAGDEEDEA